MNCTVGPAHCGLRERPGTAPRTIPARGTRPRAPNRPAAFGTHVARGLRAVLAATGPLSVGCRGSDPGAPSGGAQLAGAVAFSDRWFVRLDGLTQVRPSLGADTQRAYLAARTELTAFDLATGDVRWRSPAIAGDGSAVTSDGQLVVHAAARVTALDAVSGALRWQADAGASAGYAAPVIEGPRVYVGTGGWTGAATSVVAYARDTGAPAWVVHVGRGWPYRSDVSALAVIDGVLYATAIQCVVAQCGASVSWLVALDPTTGAERWRLRLGTENGETLVVAPPQPAAGLLLLNDYTGNATLAVDPAARRVRWRTTFQPGYYGSRYAVPPVDERGRVYVASGDQSVYALNARTGAQVWKATPGGSFAGLVRCGSTLVARRTGLVVLDAADGRVVATRLDSDREIVESNLAVAGVTIVAATSRGVAAYSCA